ncbi:MAG TPA: TIGR02587 family membrane protein [Chloroflexia bacterium]|nr:TIGR02587 family membrane protein [Chloroflexia bacterium]
MSKSKEGSWQKELDDIAHGMSGAFLFGVPLLFTMEMWWIGNFTEPLRLLIIVGLAFGANLMLAYFAGFKEERSLFANVLQAVEALAIGVVASAVVLLVLNQIKLGDSLHHMLGTITVQVLPLSIGASAANVLLSRGGDKLDEDGSSSDPGPWKAALLDFARTIGGAMFIGFSIAPTEEVPMLAGQLSPGQELALIALSLAITYLIVFVSGFSPRQEQEQNPGPFQRPISETASSYIVALLVALGALLVFSQVDLSEPVTSIIAKTLVLGLPAAIGGAAARVLL